jgi:hypothetical protein
MADFSVKPLEASLDFDHGDIKLIAVAWAEGIRAARVRKRP